MIFQKLFSIDRQLTLNELFTGGIKNISNNEDKKNFNSMKLNNKKFDYKLGLTLFDKIFKMLLPANQGLNNMSKFGINNDLDKVTFIKNIIKNKSSILSKKSSTSGNSYRKKYKNLLKNYSIKKNDFILS